MKYPNAKILFMIFIAIILVGGAFLLAEYRNRTAQTVFTKPEIHTDITSNTISNDIDWKKVLISNDLVSTSTVKDLTKKSEKLTPIDILARNFFSKYMEMNQNGTLNDASSQQELVTDIIQNGITLSKPKTYTIKDLTILNDDSKVALRYYGNAIGDIFKNNAVNARNEAVVAKEALEKKDPSILKEIDPLIENNTRALNQLIKTPVPQSLANNHLRLINAMSSVVFMDKGFRESLIDPIYALQATGLYMENSKNILEAMAMIRNSLKTNEITFLSGEGGSIFIKP